MFSFLLSLSFVFFFCAVRLSCPNATMLRCGPMLRKDLESDLAKQKSVIAKEFDLTKKKCASEIQVASRPS